MPYYSGFLTPVKIEDKERYLASCKVTWPIMREFGVLEQIETWGVDVPDGTLTSFPMAVKLEPGEAIVLAWLKWPDKATADAGWAKMMEDPRMKDLDMPFDGKRMIWGGFEQIFEGE